MLSSLYLHYLGGLGVNVEIFSAKSWLGKNTLRHAIIVSDNPINRLCVEPRIFKRSAAPRVSGRSGAPHFHAQNGSSSFRSPHFQAQNGSSSFRRPPFSRSTGSSFRSPCHFFHFAVAHTKIPKFGVSTPPPPGALILPIAIYGADSWILRQADTRLLESFEMRCLRVILGVQLMDRVKNEAIGQTLNIPNTICEKVSKRRMKWFGNVCPDATSPSPTTSRYK